MIQNTDLQAFQANITHLAVKGPADEWEGEVGEENLRNRFIQMPVLTTQNVSNFVDIVA